MLVVEGEQRKKIVNKSDDFEDNIICEGLQEY